PRHDLRVHAQLTHPSRDELRVLRAEIEDEDEGARHFSVPYPKSRSRRSGSGGRWLRCSSSTYLQIRLRRRALPSAAIPPSGRGRDFGYGTLVPELPPVGEEHRQPELIAGRDHLGVALRAAGLDDGRDPGLGGVLDVVCEREESVARERCAL